MPHYRYFRDPPRKRKLIGAYDNNNNGAGEEAISMGVTSIIFLIAAVALGFAIAGYVNAVKKPCANVDCNVDDPCSVYGCQEGDCILLHQIAGCCVNNSQCNDSDPCTIDTCITFQCVFTIIDADNDSIPCNIDCNDTDNEVGIARIWYTDADNDTDGTTDPQLIACDQPIGYAGTFTDCDDTNPFIFYGAFQCNNTLMTNQFILVGGENEVSNKAFGTAVVLQGDTLAIGAPGDLVDDDNGTVRVYHRAPEIGFGQQVFIEEALLSGPNGTFGKALALSGDILVVGARENATAWVYERVSAGNWTLRTGLTCSSGTFCGTSVAAFYDTIFVSALNTTVGGGTIEVFERVSTTQWNLTQVITPSSLTSLGFGQSATAVDQYNGEILVVGASLYTGTNAFQGGVFVYVNNGTWWNEIDILVSNFPAITGFGFAVDVDNGIIVAGGSSENSNRGNVYVFTYNGTAIGTPQIISDPTPTASEDCGSSVAIKNSTVVFSCPEDTTVASASGSVNVFRDNEGTYIWVGEFVPLDEATSSFDLGDTVGSTKVWEGNIAVGVPEADILATNDGMTFVVSCMPIPVC